MVDAFGREGRDLNETYAPSVIRSSRARYSAEMTTSSRPLTRRGVATAILVGFSALHCTDVPAPTLASAGGLAERGPPSACRPPRSPAVIEVTPAFPGLRFERPTRVLRPFAELPWLVVEQAGRIVAVAEDASTRPFLDLRPSVFAHDEEAGVLGVTFSPEYPSTGELFVAYTGRAAEGSEVGAFRTIVSRFRATSASGPLGPDVTVDPATEELVLALERRSAWHHGGALAFGPDGLLYVSTGDGEFGDPQRRAPDPKELFGKILRIDVLGQARPYASAPDNPFRLSGRPEVYATGFRNPWNVSFGPDGKLWVADVGQFRWEEIDVVEKGRHYGWPDREGAHCTFGASCADDSAPPVAEYSHVEGQAIIGGFAYRGARVPQFVGRYVFADFGSGRVWTTDANPEPGRTETPRHVIDTGLNFSAFGEDVDGELVAVDYVGGELYRIEPGSAEPEERATLKGLGCLTAGAHMDPNLIRYDVTAPLWSDGLEKKRWFSIPSGTTIRQVDGGAWEYPPGTVLLKEFAQGARRVETRMLAKDARRGWVGYAFEWNDEGTDATLLTEGKTKDLGTSAWDIPSRAACFTCHNATAGRVLGFVRAQLDRDIVYPNGAADNQLRALARAGLLEGGEAPGPGPSLVDPYSQDGTPELRVRSYLQGNCAHCHRTRGLDFRASVPLAETGLVCKPAYATNVDDATLLVAPGDAARSVLVRRVGHEGELRMPPLGTRALDTRALELLTGWVNGLSGCGAEDPGTE